MARNLSFFTLCLSLLVVTILFGLPARYGPGARTALTVLPLIATAVSAWALGRFTERTEDQNRHFLRVAGVLLITPWLLFCFLPGFGPPACCQRRTE